MFTQMLKGALMRQKGKLSMIAFTMALGVSLATAMLGVMMDVGDKVNQELKTYGANLSVVPRETALLSELYGVEDVEDEEFPEKLSGALNSQKYLPEDELVKMKMIFWAFNIVDFAPFLETPVLSDGQMVTLVGTWFDKHLDLPTGETVDTGIKRLKSWWDVTGEWARDDDDGAMLGQNLAEKLGLKIGDAFQVAANGRNETLTVRAVFYSGGKEDDQAFVPLRLAQNISNRPGLVQRVDVSALTTPENDLARRAAQNPKSLSPKEWDTWYCTAYISSIAYQIEEAIPGSRAKPVLQVAESEGAILQKTQLLMLLLTVLSLVCSALAISNLVTASVMERSSEIGLLKAIGATGAAVALLILTEIVLTSMLGGTAGYFVGLGFAQVIGRTVFGSAIAVKGLVVPMVTLLVLLVTLLGSLPAIRMLLSLRPTEVLHGR
ncbi:MAG: ABC transporter permease [Synergistaceae bacterium]|jgi:putative ABC transport system permease protein|nr:ABC transporter permease [Synergistaceae bacterium]